MIINRDSVHQHLMDTDTVFRKLVEDHRSLDSMSTSLTQVGHLTQLEEKKLQQIKRKKLLLRDRIERRLLAASHEVTQ